MTITRRIFVKGAVSTVFAVRVLGQESAPALRLGVIGCGGGGTGAAATALAVAPNVTLTAIGDLFPERIASAREHLKTRPGYAVEDARCFHGFDAYEKVLATDVDLVIRFLLAS